MVFNEYVDILNEGEAFFIDEGNLYELMMEEDKPGEKARVPANALSSSDSTAAAGEPQSQADKDPKAGMGDKAKEGAKSVLRFFKNQAQQFGKFSSEQIGKVKARISELTKKTGEMPDTIDENNDEPIEVTDGGAEDPPKLNRSALNDPQKAEQELTRYKTATEAYNEKMSKKTGKKKFIKGASKLLFARWCLKQVQKVGADVEVNLSEGKFAIGVGTRAAQQGSNGNGFFGSLAMVIKNVFLAILVLIGGIFKVLKIYLGAIGKIFASIFSTVGAAGKTLVTGQIPSNK